MLDFESIGNKIHNLRIANGYSQDTLAEMLAVSHQAVSRWELGLAAPSVENLVELCEIFDVSFETLLCLETQVDWNADDIFKNHSRMFVVKKLAQGNHNYNVAKNFNLFFPQERQILLRAIRAGSLNVDINLLLSKLTPEEQFILRGTKHRNKK